MAQTPLNQQLLQMPGTPTNAIEYHDLYCIVFLILLASQQQVDVDTMENGATFGPDDRIIVDKLEDGTEKITVVLDGETKWTIIRSP